MTFRTSVLTVADFSKSGSVLQSSFQRVLCYPSAVRKLESMASEPMSPNGEIYKERYSIYKVIYKERYSLLLVHFIKEKKKHLHMCIYTLWIEPIGGLLLD